MDKERAIQKAVGFIDEARQTLVKFRTDTPLPAGAYDVLDGYLSRLENLKADLETHL